MMAGLPDDTRPEPIDRLAGLMADQRDRTERGAVLGARDDIDQAMTANYRLTGDAMKASDYMRRPCNMLGESLDWAVLGASIDGLSAGVIAWCWDEADANDALAAIQSEGQWRGLTVECLRGESA